MRDIQYKLSVARGEEPAELLFKNAQLVNVVSGEIHETNVAVDDGRVIGFKSSTSQAPISRQA